METKIKEPITKKIPRLRDLELNIKINTGNAVFKQNNKIEITDCEDFTIEELEYLIKEAKDFIEYKERNDNKINEPEHNIQPETAPEIKIEELHHMQLL